MVASSLLLFAAISTTHPDVVVILGIPDGRDGAVIEKDCAEWREEWFKLGVAPANVVYAPELHRRSSITEVLTLARKKMTENSGDLWVCVSGHGIVADGVPAIRLEPDEKVSPQNESQFKPFLWSEVLSILSLRPGWKGTLVADLCHNNMITPFLTPGYSAILWDRPPTDPRCQIASHSFPGKGERGVISMAACASIRYWNDPKVMTVAMNEFCDSKELAKVNKNYRFRLDTFSPR